MLEHACDASRLPASSACGSQLVQYRRAKAQHAALGGPAEDVAASRKALVRAEKAAERAAERNRDALDALAYIEDQVGVFLGLHAGELLNELSDDAEIAGEETVRLLHAAAGNLARWEKIALGQQIVTSSAGDPGVRVLGSPREDLKEVRAALDLLIARLPAAGLPSPVPEVLAVRPTSPSVKTAIEEAELVRRSVSRCCAVGHVP
jgi:hypothetical protein